MLKIDLTYIKEGLYLEIEGEDKTLSVISDEEVVKFGEAKFQLKEGCMYEYQFSDKAFNFKEGSKRNAIVFSSRFGKYKGLLKPNIYVGTHSLEIENSEHPILLEVQSVKSKYRSDYRFMLENIAEKCVDLIMQIDAPVSQYFETNFDINSKTLYQRFTFVKSLIDSLEFEEAIQKIISNPTSKWLEIQEDKDIRNIKRFNRKSVRQIVNKSNRQELDKDNYLFRNYSIGSIPSKIESTLKVESIDTVENRFVKHVLDQFLFFVGNCEAKFEKYSTAKSESELLAIKISSFLNQSFFKQISRPNSLNLNSPVLQRKSGYREVLNAWLKFDLAAKLSWHGGDNVYEAGKKNVAALYEYWIFFALLDLFKEMFSIEPKNISDLIQFDNGGLSLNLKQGKTIAMKGVYKSSIRNLNIEFYYNRSFGGGQKFPNPGSYTTTLRPDYTLSIWPEEIKDAIDAEKNEMITHIHFDAKYKVNNFFKLILESDTDEITEAQNLKLLKEEAYEDRKGTYKNQDLLKMHAYKDAIRRTGGAYVLYPGKGKGESFRGFHELIPGLGAFVIKPKKDHNGTPQLKEFIEKVLKNFIDRASQREHLAVKMYDIYKKAKKDEDVFMEKIPEYFNEYNKSILKKLIPNETFVLVAYYKGKEHLDWILKNLKYNIRYDDSNYKLGLEELGSKYLILYTKGDVQASLFYKITNEGPVLYTNAELKNIAYPFVPSKEIYMIYSIEEIDKNEFGDFAIDLDKLCKNRADKKPFPIRLNELLKLKVK